MIYLDNAATTKISEPVLKAMMPYLMDQYGNPSSAYTLGTKARDAIEQARKYVADLINAEPEEIYFTSGGTESNNWAISSFLWSDEWFLVRGDVIATSRIEHPSILNTCNYLERMESSNVLYLPVDATGIVQTDVLDDYSEDEIAMLSVMFANNEIGTIQPISDLGKMCRKRNIILHTDAVQAFGQIPIDVKKMNIDMLSASGHKVHAPKGVGCLYIRNGLKLSPYIHGGHQEHGMRAGTENVASVVGFGEAAYQAKRTMKKRMKQTVQMRDYIWMRIQSEIPECFLNGDQVNRLPGNLSITFEGIYGSALVLLLDKMGICISAGSACSSGDLTPSYVLKAIGLSDKDALGTVRITLDEKLTLDEANYTIEAIKKNVERLRKH